MNAITKALTEVKFNIPAQVLQLAFMEKDDRVNTVISLDEAIMNKVVRPRILVDLNLISSASVKIDLSRCIITFLSNREFLVEVPKVLTNNKSIVSALSLVSNVIYSQSTPYNDTPAALTTGINMMNSLGTENVIQTSRLELIGDNIISVMDPTVHLENGVLRATIENDTNLGNINPKSYRAISKVFILAIKSYIYNHSVILLDQGFIYGGHELGVIKDIIETYSEAEEQYQEELKMVTSKVLFMNNSDAHYRNIRSMFGNTI